jgi:transposase
MNDEAVELVGKGARGGKRVSVFHRKRPRFAAGELSTNPQLFAGLVRAARRSLGTLSPSGSMGRPHRFADEPERLLGSEEPAFFARMGTMRENTTDVFAGIDISKDALDIGLLPSKATFHLPYDEKGIAEAVQRLAQAKPTLIVLEATGGLETRVAAHLVAGELPVAVVNPRQPRDYAKATGQLAKNDRIDALILADFARAVRPQVRPMKDESTQELDGLVTRRNQLVDIRVQENLRLNRAPKVQQKSLRNHIAWLDKGIAAIEKDLTARLRNSDAWRVKDDLLRGIPGVGPTTSAVMLAKLPELGTLDRKKIAALTGVAPLADDSGKHHGKRFVWGGRADVRSVLYMAALTAMRWNPVIKSFAQRLKSAGKPAKVIIVACMRKLLIIMNAIIKNNQPWDPKIT